MSNVITSARRRQAADRARAFRARRKEAGRPDDRTVDAALGYAVGASIGRVAFSDADTSTKQAAAPLLRLDCEVLVTDAVAWLVRKGHDRIQSRAALKERIADRSREWRSFWKVREGSTP